MITWSGLKTSQLLETQAKTIIDWHLLSPRDKPQHVEYKDLGAFFVETIVACELEEKTL